MILKHHSTTLCCVLSAYHLILKSVKFTQLIAVATLCFPFLLNHHKLQTKTPNKICIKYYTKKYMHVLTLVVLATRKTPLPSNKKGENNCCNYIERLKGNVLTARLLQITSVSCILCLHLQTGNRLRSHQTKNRQSISAMHSVAGKLRFTTARRAHKAQSDKYDLKVIQAKRRACKYKVHTHIYVRMYV